MKTINFATENSRKIGEARLACDMFGIRVVQVRAETTEIQSNNPKEISENKAQQAFEQIKKPLVVTDSYWEMPALNGFPGGYMKDVARWFSSEDFINLMKNKKNKKIAFSENITYIDKSRIKLFSSKYWGRMVMKPRGTGNSIENVAEFEGVTLGERRSQGGYSHKPENYIWYPFAKWYSKL